ncbi:hypothetical protein Q7P37_009011 [Cladosporium fusiforme]
MASNNQQHVNSQPGSALCMLPGELRNQIYRYVLVHGEGDPANSYELSHNSSPLLDPPLLQTCRQIRAEAHKIFWKENEFEVTILNCGIINFLNWHKAAKSHQSASLILSLRFTRPALGDHDDGTAGPWVWYDAAWDNLMEWVRAYMEGRSFRVGTRSSYGVPRPVAAGPFDIVIQVFNFVDALIEELLLHDLDREVVDLRFRAYYRALIIVSSYWQFSNYYRAHIE